MLKKETALLYMNTLAKALSFLESFSGKREELFTYGKHEEIARTVNSSLNTKICTSLDAYIDCAEKYIDSFNGNIVDYITALTLCINMDLRIIYESDDDSDLKVSIWSLIPYTMEGTYIIGALNDNVTDTGIWINPRYSTFSFYKTTDSEERSVEAGNRSARYRYNNDLHNCSYFNTQKYDRSIKNVIIDFQSKALHNDFFRIGFAPITDERDILRINEIRMGEDGKQRGILPSLNKSLDDRVLNSWEYACGNNVDLFFAPEMLGSCTHTDDDNGYNKLIHNESKNDDIHPPILTFFPSVWGNNKNVITIINDEGCVIGEKVKEIPFYDKDGKMLEAIDTSNKPEIVIVHIPGAYRISVLICSEFIYDDDEAKNLRDFLLESLLVSLVIVPSFSSGEMDFINHIYDQKKYGATTIWGNCCGAANSPDKAIGGVVCPGNKNAILFSNACKCNNMCKDNTKCIFLIDLPSRQLVAKTKDNYEDIVQHMIAK